MVFDSFDLDSGGALDRRELSQFISASIFGLCKAVGIPEPTKMQVSKFVSDQYHIVDNDGSGQIELEEFEKWLNDSMEI